MDDFKEFAFSIVYVHRRSNYIAVLAVAPASDNLSLYHVTYINLKVCLCMLHVHMYVWMDKVSTL